MQLPIWFKRSAIAAVLAGAAFSIATLVSASDDPAPRAPARATPPTPALDAALVRRYTVFRRALDAARAPAVEPVPIDAQPGIVVNVGELPGGRAVRASANSARVCVFFLDWGAEGEGGACDEPSVAARRGIFTSTVYAADDLDVVGLMPDGVRSVVFTGTKGERRELPVVGNGFAAALKFRLSALDFETPSGPVHSVLDSR